MSVVSPVLRVEKEIAGTKMQADLFLFIGERGLGNDFLCSLVIAQGFPAAFPPVRSLQGADSLTVSLEQPMD